MMVPPRFLTGDLVEVLELPDLRTLGSMGRQALVIGVLPSDQVPDLVARGLVDVYDWSYTVLYADGCIGDHVKGWRLHPSPAIFDVAG